MWIDWKSCWCKCKSRLQKEKKIIVKFSRRKDTERALQNKNKNNNVNPRSLDIDSNKVFINENLCCHYKFLRSKCKKLWIEEWIRAFWVSSGQIKLSIEPEGAVSLITHIQDLQKLLPDYNF